MEWDSESYEPPPLPSIAASKWEGEDEDDVKDSWDAEEDEESKKEAQKKPAVVAAKKPKTKLEEKIEERERLEREKIKLKGKKQLDDEEFDKDLTPEELQAEKLRRQKLQEEADLEMAKEMLGIDDEDSVDRLNPKTKSDFTTFAEALTRKINNYKSSEHFPYFAEELVRNICVHLNSNELKNLRTTVENVFNEKLKAEKPAKKKGKGKAKLRLEGDNAVYNEYSAYTIDDYDEFM